MEIELPFIQTVFPHARIVAAINGRKFSNEFLDEFVDILVDMIGSRSDVLLVISTDMSHFHDDKTARRLDKAGYKAMEALDSGEILANNGKTMEIDGVFPVLTAIKYAQKLKLKTKILKYGNSGDITGDRSSVVGYASLAYYGKKDVKIRAIDTNKLNDEQKNCY